MARILAALVSPLGTSLLVGLLGLVIAIAAPAPRRRRIGHVAAMGALAWLWLWSTPWASDELRRRIEEQAGPPAIDAVPAAEVMVVLGGGVGGAMPPRRPHADLLAPADRVWHAARLFHSGKARTIILSGGVVEAGAGSEAEAMRQFLLALGVPDSAMILEPGSTNTRENARNSAALLGSHEREGVLLVTSALHMPRARALFEDAGVRVIPAPTDFEVVDKPFSLGRLVPSASALEGSGRGMKEIVGRWVLR